MQHLWGAWLADAEKRGVFAPVVGHDCQLSCCSVQRIPLYYCVDDSICMGASPPTMGWIQRGKAGYYESGGRPECARGHHGRDVPVTDIAIYFCPETGTPHLCGRQCILSLVNSDGGVVCTLTGQVLEESRVTTGLYGDPDNMIGRAPLDTREFNNATLSERALDFVGATQHAPRLQPNYDSFSAHALLHITAMLSPQRFEREEQHMDDRTDALRERLEQHIQNRRQPIDILQLLLLAAQHRKKDAGNMHVTMSPDITRRLAPHYVAIVLGLWGLLRTQVPGGGQIAKRAAFKDFIVVALELYKIGITVRDRTDRYDVQLLPPDPILSTVGISDHAKEIALSKTVSNKNIGRLRKTVVSLLQSAITEHQVSPECLRICEAAEKIRELPDSAFQ